MNPAKGNLLAAGSYFLKAAELNVAESGWLGRAVARAGAARKLGRGFNGRGRIALLLWTPVPFLRPIDSLWQRADFRADVVAVFTIQRALRTAVAAGLRGICAARDFVSSSSRQPSFRSFRLRGAIGPLPATLLVILFLRFGELCRNLARQSHLLSGGRYQHEGPRRARSPTREVDQVDSRRFDAADVSGRTRGRAGASWHPAAADHQRRQSSRVETASRPGWLVGARARGSRAYADYAVGFEGDPVWTAAHDHHLMALVEIHTTGQPPAAIFQARTPPTPTHPAAPRSAQ